MENTLENKSLWNRFGLLIIAALVLGVLGIIATVFQVQKQQETRTRATEEGLLTLLFSPESVTIRVEQDLPVKLALDAKNYNITGIDVTFVFDRNVFEVARIEKAATFDTAIFEDINNSEGKLRLAYVNISNKTITGGIDIGTIVLRGKAEGESNLRVVTAQVTAQGINESLKTGSVSGTYKVDSSATSTPAQTSNLPTSSPSPVPTRKATYNMRADLNDDGKVDELDLNILYSGFAKRKGD